MLRSRCFHESQWRFFVFMYNFYIKYLYKILCIILTHYGSSIVMDFCTIPCESSGDTYCMQAEYMIILPSLLPKSRRQSSGLAGMRRHWKYLIFIQASPHEFLTMNL